jgi:hypothetical protein
MDPKPNDYVPFLVFLLTIISIRISQPSIKNSVRAALGAVIAWCLSPTKSLSGQVISLGLMVFAFALSPFMSPTRRIAGESIVTVRRWLQHSQDEDKSLAGSKKTTDSTPPPPNRAKNPRRATVLHPPQTQETQGTQESTVE